MELASDAGSAFPDVDLPAKLFIHDDMIFCVPKRLSRARWIPLASAAVVFSLSAAEEGIEELVVPAETPPGAPAPVVVVETGPAAKPETAAADAELEQLRKERERIAAENALAQEKQRRELFALEAEKQRLALENSLRVERLNAEVAGLRTELDRITLQTEALNKKAALEAAERREELDRDLAAVRAEEERLRAANALAAQKAEGRLAQLRVQETEVKVQRAELEVQLARLQTELSRREKAEILRDLVPDEQKYTSEPFRAGTLMISDRRIGLNGVILPSLADQVAERIDYFNNQNTEYPIFLVIDYSPGGSVMAGYKILKAMDGSKAPVYVVVKSFAASMAATIVTLAERSFAYPNAIILHHQIAWLAGGNLTQQREQLAEFEQWWRRLAQPVAAKMGLSLDEFVARMYKKNSDGDWLEFADKARELKWIDEIVDTIWETSLDKNPDRFGPRPVLTMEVEEKTDGQGVPYGMLPRLQPFDYYFLHNRDGYFRVR